MIQEPDQPHPTEQTEIPTATPANVTHDRVSSESAPAAAILPRRPPSQVRRILTNRRVWAVLIVLIGLWLMAFFGSRTLRAYREFEYAREQGLLNGTASVEAIQPWMTIRYIAVAYAVPEEYIYAKLDIPFDRRSEREPLGRIGRRPQPDTPPDAGPQLPADDVTDHPARDAIVEKMREVILAYRENPVAPGLRDIRPWMSLAYIANSTGVPVDYLMTTLETSAIEFQATEFADREGTPPGMQAELDTEENRYKPLDLLSDELHYPGGPEQLLETVHAAVDNYVSGSRQK